MRIAVTGGIAEGKSTVLATVREMGIPVYSADDEARILLSNPVWQEKVAAALDLPLPLDRAKVRTRILESNEARRALNGLLHRPILDTLLAHPEGFFEVPLLIETCAMGRFDQVWVATCGLEEQRRRLADRVGDPALAEKLLATQLPTRAKTPFADLIVRTDRPFACVSEYVRKTVSMNWPR